jgi:hypothetical protein
VTGRRQGTYPGGRVRRQWPGAGRRQLGAGAAGEMKKAVMFCNRRVYLRWKRAGQILPASTTRPATASRPNVHILPMENTQQ